MGSNEHSVTFTDTKQCASDTGEGEFDSDGEKTGRSHILSRSSSAIRSCADGDAASNSSISTSILDDGEEIKTLKDKLQQSEAKCRLLMTEKETVMEELTSSRQRISKLEKKLQFVKDNQEVFLRLKEAYINMKYNEAAGRKMVEIREKSMQTWDGILCRSCLETYDLKRELENTKQRYSESVFISKYELNHLITTVKYLKDLIDRREKTWEFFNERDTKMRTQLIQLENENNSLKELAKAKYSTTEEIELGIKPNENSKEMTQLKKIVIKLMKRYTDILEDYDINEDKYSFSLNDKEKLIIEDLMKRYHGRLHRKSQDKVKLSSSRDKKTNSKPTRKKLLVDSTENIGKHEEILISDKTGKAIMMMETLFDSNSRIN